MRKKHQVETRKITRQEAEQCASEPLHHIGAVQPHGFVLVVDLSSSLIVQYSDNFLALLNPTLNSPLAPSTAIIGTPLTQWLGVAVDDISQEIFASAMQMVEFEEGGLISPERWECLAGMSGGYAMFEFFPTSHTNKSRTILSRLDRMVMRIGGSVDIDALFVNLTEEFQRHTDYDRVMLYRFLPDWSGEVISETVSDNTDVKFLGMRFPAEDIPKQARELYKNSALRIMADVDAEPARLVPAALPDGQPLDQSISVLRGMSPMHVTYLKNMGVRASMSIALMSKGELWGLLAFHHYTPKVPPNHLVSEMKASCELFADIVISHLHPAIDLAQMKRTMQMRQDIEHAFKSAKAHSIDTAYFGTILASLSPKLDFDYIGVGFGDNCYVAGIDEQFGCLEVMPAELVGVTSASEGGLFQSHHLEKDAPTLNAAIKHKVGGLIALQSPLLKGFTVFFAAKEIEKHIDWGGEPESVNIVEKNGERWLEPRSSFALWRQHVHGQSEPWNESSQELIKVFLAAAERFALHCHNENLKNKLYKKSYTDPLTELPNRSYLQEHMTKLEQQGECRFITVFFLDLDNFKRVNDYVGHHAGDNLLIEVAKRLQACVRPNDVVVRLGGDEFVVVICHETQERHLIQAASERVANKILKVVGQPFFDADMPIVTSASIGALICEPSKLSYNDILRKSDIAMYRAKQAGKNRIHVFSDDDQEEVIQEGVLESELRAALEHCSIQVFYQPQTDEDDRVIGCEALARWHHPTMGDISPDVFIPLAERSNLIVSLGEVVFEQAFKAMSEWTQNPACSALNSLSINLSPTQLLAPGCTDMLIALTEKYHLSARFITLEITENLFMQHFEQANILLSQLREHGFKVALDDFGTGYSSLGYLWKLPIDIVKIDRLFILNMDQDGESLTLVEGIIGLCKKLKLTVVAEGVETKQQALVLHGFGCDVMQGFYFGRPVPAEAFCQQMMARQ